MKIRFQADNDLDQRIVVATRRLDPKIDYQTAHALKLHGVPDTLVLQRTADAAEFWFRTTGARCRDSSGSS
jgi:hypothetical protein